MRHALLLGLFVVSSLCFSPLLAADPIDYSAALAAANFGNLKQGDMLVCPLKGCAPAAATNSFAFLEKTYAKKYGGKLIRNPGNVDKNGDGKVNEYDGLIATADDLAKNFMNTAALDKTLRNDFVSGKSKYLETHAKDATVYEVMDDPELNKLDFVWDKDLPAYYKASKPTPQWLSANLKSGQDIEILITRDDGTKLDRGHYVTVTQLKWTDHDTKGTRGSIDDADGAATLSFIDPGSGTERTLTLKQRANGLLYVVNTQGMERDIRFAVKESPKPEPSVPTGASTTGSSGQSLSFDPATGALSLSSFPLTAAYIASALGPLDTSRIDPVFAIDPILGATVAVSPFFLGQRFDDGRIAFSGFDGVVTISKGDDLYLTAFVPTLMFDPFLTVPFYAPLQVLDIDTTLRSPFLAEMQSRLATPGALPFDFFISPYEDFQRVTHDFTTFGKGGADAGVAQNGKSVPEPSTVLLFAIAAVGALADKRRRRGSRFNWSSFIR